MTPFLAQPPFTLTPLVHGLDAALQQFSPLTWTACAIILVMAVLCYARLLLTTLRLRHAAAEDAEFFDAYEASAHSLALFQERRAFINSPSHALYETGCKELCLHLLGTDLVDNQFTARLSAAGRISPSQMDAVRRAMKQTLDRTLLQLPVNVGTLSLASLPLFGFVGSSIIWMEDARLGKDFSLFPSLAPFTIGLLLCWPVIAWQLALAFRVRHDAARIRNFASDLSRLFDRAFVDHRSPMDTLPSLGHMGPTFAESPSPSAPAKTSVTPSPSPASSA